MEFLYDTTRVTTDAIDEAMTNAASFPRNGVNTMEFLCSKDCASSHAVEVAFAHSRTFTMVKILYETYRISEEEIVNAFKDASGWGRTNLNIYNEDRAQIVKLLYKEQCISPEVIDKALVTAVFHDKSEIAELLCNDPRVSFDAICDAFAGTNSPKSVYLLRYLYGKRWTKPDAMLRAFRKAAFRGRVEGAQVIVDIIFQSKNVPRTLKHKILALAMEENVLHYLQNIEFGYCTRSMRKEILQLTTTRAAKICAQKIFDTGEL
ncbi:hypothetical protein GN244_ATG08169 [Phytophthora infestans]|uniref:Uncharacterized protein n=1 Tax=Phytophthora infestans TaxID=4787 RepID=A0A833T4Z4_PHYIN|nr:hypothetical protein GN244_ATG08169 [Phytophthora infestans]KAF4145635.1 hypothetical protein GN958_ATG05175 [Phytophthora infestans]